MSDLLPPNATGAERALSLAMARVGAVPVPIRSTLDPDTCPAVLLPWLAWAESVDDWDASWPEARKRAVIKASMAVHQHKGTVGALLRAFSTLGLDLSVREWFQQTPPAAPFTFEALITIDQVGITDTSAFDTVIAVANSAKNLRSKMTGIDMLGLSRGTTYFAGAMLSGEIVTVHAEAA